MYEKFDHPSKAIAFLVTGLRKDFTDAEAEVSFFHHGRVRKRTIDIPHIAPVLEQYCKKFPKVTVEYRPDNPYGYVAEIQCHGETNPGRKTQFIKRGDSPRPRVVVLITKIRREELMFGRRVMPKRDKRVSITVPDEE